MKFIWDESKRISNLKKHDLDFALTYLVFEHDTFTFEDNRITYDERRFVTLGLLNGIVVVVVHTETDDVIRVISLRKALKMNKNFISPMSDDFDEYPEINQANLDISIRRRNFVEVPKKQHVNLILDSDIVAWFKKKSGEEGFQALINTTLRVAITRKSKRIHR